MYAHLPDCCMPSCFALQYTLDLKVSALMVKISQSVRGSFIVMYGHLAGTSFQVLSVHLLLNSELYLANTTDLHSTSVQILHYQTINIHSTTQLLYR